MGDVAIHHLHVKAPRAEAERGIRALQQSTWPDIGQDWLFIRSIDIKARSDELPRVATDRLRSEAHAAVDGRSPLASGAAAVRFASLPSLLAFLLRDAALGRLATVWFWRRWEYLFRESPDNAVARILFEHYQLLPAVVHALITEASALKIVWEMLTPQAATVIQKELVKGLPAISQQHQTHTLCDKGRPNELRQVEHLFLRRFDLFRAWKFALREITPDDARRALAVTVLTQQFFPHHFSSPVIQHTIHEALLNNESFVGEKNETRGKAASVELSDKRKKSNQPRADQNRVKARKENHADSNTEQIRRKSSEPLLEKSQKRVEAVRRLTTEKNETAKAPTEEDRVKQASKVLRSAADSNGHSKLSKAAPNNPPTQAFKHHDGLDVSEHFFTEWGGVFYLINALRLSIGDQWPWPDNPWVWLYNCARSLEVKLDQPLIHYLAAQAAMAPAEFVETTQPESVSAWLTQQDVNADIATLLDADLLRRKAQIRHSPSHIDVYFPMHSIEIRVRLAGLDVNPGWVPWLGRVVAFHYRGDSDG